MKFIKAVFLPIKNPSPSLRRVWVEIYNGGFHGIKVMVTLLAEGVG